MEYEFTIDTSRMCKHLEYKKMRVPMPAHDGFPEITGYNVGCSEDAVKDGLCAKHQVEGVW